MAYSDKVLDHYENPRNVGSFGKDDEAVGTGMVGAPGLRRRDEAADQVGKDGLIEDAQVQDLRLRLGHRLVARSSPSG